jgi:hypothetical protein
LDAMQGMIRAEYPSRRLCNYSGNAEFAISTGGEKQDRFGKSIKVLIFQYQTRINHEKIKIRRNKINIHIDKIKNLAILDCNTISFRYQRRSDHQRNPSGKAAF